MKHEAQTQEGILNIKIDHCLMYQIIFIQLLFRMIAIIVLGCCIKNNSKLETIFDGSIDSIAVEEIIYRVNALTVSTLGGNFNALCQSAHILFLGRAQSRFWRYHHSANALDWFDICNDLRRNFKVFKTDLDIKEPSRNRRQQW